ncbi:Mitochondrial dicarboxylate/tricarboxylate transporter DTC (Dicarboxylate/tricarboxylate carrier) [Durusdinium trenchii]|uniref:Mitochondrial dicarboxylate/tricarboxylate transporter DTC (Dicarboxylate/tricarboxylate carrier) n=1 Tax=Durusdinium trenchii TaxID=1381693 RepID=A0ABP0HBX3_9DINO
MADNPVWKACKPFATGSLSGMFATCCIQPIDMVKVRIQLTAGTAEAAGPMTIVSSMLKNEGIGAFYTGLTAGLTRQVVYTGARLGLFDQFTGMVKKPGKSLSVVENGGCALAAGGLAALIGNPADLALIRMQADSMKPVAERAGYSNVFTTMGKIVASEGPLGLMAGAAPTATRAMALNLGMLAGNSIAKDNLASFGVTGGPLVFGASAIAGFFASFFSLPFDFVKTQMQKQKKDPVTGELPYKSSIDCATKIMAEGGPLRFYAGFPTYYVRIAPHAMLTLIAQDFIKKSCSADQRLNIQDMYGIAQE